MNMTRDAMLGTTHLTRRCDRSEGTPMARLFVGEPPRLKLEATREEARARLRPPTRGEATMVLDLLAATVTRRRSSEGTGDVVPRPRLLDLGDVDRRGAGICVRGWTGRAPDRARPSDGWRAADADGWRHLAETRFLHPICRLAGLVESVREDGPHPDAPEVLRMRLVVTRPMTVAQAVASSGDGAAGLRALVRLIDDRAVRLRDGWSIDDRATVEPVGFDARRAPQARRPASGAGTNVRTPRLAVARRSRAPLVMARPTRRDGHRTDPPRDIERPGRQLLGATPT